MPRQKTHLVSLGLTQVMIRWGNIWQFDLSDLSMSLGVASELFQVWPSCLDQRVPGEVACETSDF